MADFNLFEIFDELIDLPAADRAARLEGLRATNPGAAREVEELLGANDHSQDFLEQPITIPTTSLNTKLLSRLPRPYYPGEVLNGEFEIGRELGAGSFGRVYQATQRSLGRQVAIKICANVGQEARTMARLEHEGIVQVFSETLIDRDEHRVICMQLVQGLPLSHIIDYLRGLPRPWNGADFFDAFHEHGEFNAAFDPELARRRQALFEASSDELICEFGWRLADATHFAHSSQVLHLDIKPENILVNVYGMPYLSDFNVSLSKTAVEGQGVLGGTPQYMSPEHAKRMEGESVVVDERSDVFSLGRVLRDLRQVNDEYASQSDDLDELLKQCLSENPVDRPSSANELASALRNCQQLRQACAKVPPVQPFEDRFFNHPILYLFFLALGPQMVGSIFSVSYNGSRIVSALSRQQQDMFHNLVVLYNLLVYPVCIVVCYVFGARFLRLLSGFRGGNQSLATSLRTASLRLPFVVLAIASVGWLPGALLFPWLIDVFSPPVAASVYWHFFVSFLVSWLVAAPYSFMFLMAVSLLIVYRQAWRAGEHSHDLVERELRQVQRGVNWSEMGALSVPLVGAVLVLSISDGYALEGGFRLLLVGLIVMGLAGYVIASNIAGRLRKLIAVMSGGRLH